MATDAPEKHNADITPDIPGLRSAEQEGGGFYNPDDRDNKPAGDPTDPRGEDLKTKENSVGGFYNPNEKKNGSLSLKKLSRKKKWLIGGVLGAGGLLTGLVGLFMGLGSLNLSNFMANVESRTFLRYQVDMDGRSSKWINAYIRIRMGEVAGGDPLKDNVYFKAARVDNNNPATDWYKTLRSSKFEQDIFTKHGIIFQSVAERNGDSIRFRTAFIKANNKVVALHEPGSKAWSSFTQADFNKLSAGFDKDFNIETMKDPEARKALRGIIKEEYPHWWQAYKRRYLRLDMQNRLGIRKWHFFETTRNDIKEGYRDRRNRVIAKVIESSAPKGASQNFLNCLFGTNSCNAHSDPGNPKVAEEVVEFGAEEAAKRFIDAKLEEGGEDATIRAKTGVNELQGALDVQNDAWKAGNFAAGNAGTDVGASVGSSSAIAIRQSVAQIMKRTNQLAMLDALMQFHGMIKAGDLSRVITATKAAYTMGLFATFKIADDQMKTGNMNGDEFGDFMSQYGNLSNGEGWTAITGGSSKNNSASAASNSYQVSDNKEDFCSPEHQEEMLKPKNKQAAEKEYQYLCPQDVVGSRTRAKVFEDQWNKTVGWFMDPLQAAYEKTPLGPINQVISTIIDKTFGAAVAKGAEIMGVMDSLDEGIAFVAEKALTFGGANMNIDPSTPSGRMGNLVVEGGASLAEMSSRMSGAAITNDTTSQRSTNTTIAYEQRHQQESSFYERYLSIDNPRSFAASQIPVAASLKYSSFTSSISSTVASIFSIPSKIMSLPVSASTPDGYAASRLADIDTYDFPAECINSDPLDMTPASATNADELGYIPASELDWSTMSSKTEWFNLLYEKVGSDEEKAQQVWNCALLDNTIRGSIGASYGYKGEDMMDDANPSAESASVPTGDVQELAKIIVDSGKVSGDPRYYSQIQQLALGNNSCPVDSVVLTMLAGVAQEGHSIYITSLNRKCTEVLTASGTGSNHYRDKGGHAVDIGMFNGATVNGGNTATLKFLKVAVKYLPQKGVEYGQVLSCGSGFDIPEGSRAVEDSCNHQHIGIDK